VALISLVSAKGAPGTTTAALAMAAVWPRPVLLADCDPAGGDVALRMPAAGGGAVERDRGLISIAAASRRGLTGAQVREHVQRLDGGLEILAGVRSPEQAAASAKLWGPLGSALDALDGLDVLADCGRISDETNALLQLPILRSSRLVVLVTRTEATEVVHLRERAEALAEVLRSRAVDGVPLGVLVVAPWADKRDVEGVQRVLHRDEAPVTFLGHLALDPKGAEAFHGQPAHRLERTMLVRSARALTARLAQGLEPYWTPTAQDPGSTEEPAETLPAETLPAETLPGGAPPTGGTP
jgi:hypothetical protein